MATTIQPTVNENFGMSQSIIWKCEKVTEWQSDRGQGGRVTGWQGDRVTGLIGTRLNPTK